MEEEAKKPPSITLRPFTLSDVDDFMSWASDDRVARFCTFEAYTTKAPLVDYITTTVLLHPYFRAICVGGRPVGSISVSPTSDVNRGEIGYVLAYEHWGTGIATAAVVMAVAEVFEEWKELERVEGLVDVDNKGSQRVLEKAGFHREGVLRKYWRNKGKTRDMVMFSFLKTDHVTPPAA